MRNIATCVLILLSILLMSSCSDTETAHSQGTAAAPSSKTSITQSSSSPSHKKWASLIDSHTQGKVSRHSNILIRFKKAIIDKSKLGSSANSIFSISPKVKGSAVFESAKQIAFVPDAPLASGQQYTVTLQPNGLQGLSDKDAPWSFSFSVIPLEYELTTDALHVDPDNPEHMQLKGTVLFSDRVEGKKVSKLLTASLQGKPLNINWQADGSGRQFRFSTSPFTRETFATDVQLKWDGAPLGIKTKGETLITIPPENEFKVLEIKRISPKGDKPYIRITLSDLRDKTQNLKGLIRLEPIPDTENPTPKAVPFKLSSEGNIIKLFPKDGTTGKFNVAVESGLKGRLGTTLGKKVNETIELETLKPGIRFVGKGHILPESKVLEIPFEAANVNAVKVKAFLIDPDNIAQFLQVNSLSGDNELERVGRYLWQKTIPLTTANAARWNRYTFDASELMRTHPGGLFRLELSIDRRYSLYECPKNTPKSLSEDAPLENYEDSGVSESSGWDGVENYLSEDQNPLQDWRWEDRNNACTDAYFQFEDNPVSDSRNFIASNIGLLAKQDSHNQLLVIATDLKTAKPLSNVELRVQNFQYQPLATAKTDNNGMAKIKLDATPFLLIAHKDKQTGYLKLNGSTALSVSHFDVGGKKLKKGLNGFIYGERGVWRPGDNIYLTFVVQDKDHSLPPNHPVSMQLYNPRGKLVQSQTNTHPVGDFYAFTLKTDEKAETGKYLVKAKLGGAEFSKTLTIETVRPNRLKIDLDFGTDVLLGFEPLPQGKLFSQWLHGATASGLKADISVRFREKKTRFERFSDYIFDDPARELDSSEQQILQGRLDDTGTLLFNKSFKPESTSPGMLSAWFTTRVFEEGGGFSISKQFMDYHPFRDYVGIKLPKGDAARNMLLTDTPHTVHIASLSALGEPVDLERVQMTLYKIDWKWWWDKSPESLAAFSHANHNRQLQQDIVQTHNGQGEWQFTVKYPDWGRYLIRACDLDGKHCSGQIVYIDWPGWAGRAQEQNNSAASTLKLLADKESYQVGEIAKVQLPKASQGRALVTVESGSEILDQQWVEFNEQRQQVEIPIKANMAPNVYVSVSLLQPHENKKNDRPIRLLGIIPLKVSDPATHLQPVIAAAEEWQPKKTHSVVVSESQGRAMTYTLAMVDEGLLGLTRYKTPNLHDYFYSKQALGIKSWDLFDDVVGAYGGKLERLLALGGGDDVQLDDAANRPKRFPPVVQFLGPFHLEKGKTRTHELTLPAYLGAVRLMLVAGEQGAYGAAEKSIFVRQPLMIQPSLPRVLSVNEEVIVPVTLFATQDDIKNVELTVSTDQLVQVEKSTTQVTFEKTGDKLGYLHIKAGKQPGQSHLRFSASSGNYHSEAEVYLDIRRPNTLTSRFNTYSIDAGNTGQFSVTPHGIAGSNSLTVEVSSAPPLALEKHLDYLVSYPHGCLEQVTSSAFPQLYLSQLTDIGAEREKRVESHIKQAIERIRSYQDTQGDFSYWPGGNEHNAWASLYAGHFLLQAKRAGYTVSPLTLNHWLNYQKGMAQRWIAGSNDYAYVQAYRLYLLALAGKPELGAMNRFRENRQPGRKAKWLLAAAYKLAGQNDAAKQTIEGLVADPDATTEQHSDTFSTPLTDLGIQLTALTTLGMQQDADHFVKAIADVLKQNKNQHNTHGIAWALTAVSRYLSGNDNKLGITTTVSLNDDAKEISSKKAYSSMTWDTLTQGENTLKIRNPGKHKLSVSVISKGLPEAGTETAAANGVELTTTYRLAESKEVIDLNDDIPQGKDIQIEISVHNNSDRTLDNIALSHLIPAGMQIHNPHYGNNSPFDYQDVRDDRVYTYFKLKDNETRHFSLLVNPSWSGRFYLPAVSANSMYQPEILARIPGQWIEISAETADDND